MATKSLMTFLIANGLWTIGLVAQPMLTQDGRALDSNPNITSGGLNQSSTPVGLSGPSINDLIVTGNIRGGRSFSDFSPVLNTSELQVGLGSDALFGFRRDSVSVGDVYQPRSFSTGDRFYSSTRTVLSAGDIHGGVNSLDQFSGIAPEIPVTVQPLPGLDLAAHLRQQTSALGAPTMTTVPLNVPVYSELFGYRPYTEAEKQEFLQNLAAAQEEEPAAELAFPEDPAVVLNPQQETEAPGVASQLNTDLALDDPNVTRLNREMQEQLARQEAKEEKSRVLVLHTPEDEVDILQREAEAQRKIEQEMREQQAQLPTDETTGESPTDKYKLPDELVKAENAVYEKRSIRRQVPLAESTLNEGYRLMRASKYYEAAAKFGLTTALRRTDHRGWFGRGHALFGAGEYVSALQSIILGVKATEDLSLVKFDLVGDFASVQECRDRFQMLVTSAEATGDLELRFLAAYIRFAAGEREAGIDAMSRTARLAPPNSIYPSLYNRFERELQPKDDSP